MLTALSVALAALGLTSCTGHGAGPEQTPTPRQWALAYGLHASYHEWDEAWAERNFDHPERIRPLLEWLYVQAGDCAQPTLFFVRDPRYARFLYDCERGQFEAGWLLESPYAVEVERVYLGMRGAEPAPEVRRAAEDVLALLESWDRDAAAELFADGFDLDELGLTMAKIHDQRGTCTLGPTDLANERGAVWFLDCEHSPPARMKISLRDDDRVGVMFVRNRRKERLEP